RNCAVNSPCRCCRSSAARCMLEKIAPSAICTATKCAWCSANRCPRTPASTIFAARFACWEIGCGKQKATATCRLPQRFQPSQTHRRQRRHQPAHRTHDQGEEKADGQGRSIYGEFEDDELAAAAGAAGDNTVGRPPVRQAAQGATQHPTDEGNHQRFQEE